MSMECTCHEYHDCFTGVRYCNMPCKHGECKPEAKECTCKPEGNGIMRIDIACPQHGKPNVNKSSDSVAIAPEDVKVCPCHCHELDKLGNPVLDCQHNTSCEHCKKPETNGSEENWEKELDGKFVFERGGIKSFIREILAKERERILQGCRLEKKEYDEEYEVSENLRREGYTQAVDELEKKLEGLKD